MGYTRPEQAFYFNQQPYSNYMYSLFCVRLVILNLEVQFRKAYKVNIKSPHGGELYNPFFLVLIGRLIDKRASFDSGFNTLGWCYGTFLFSFFFTLNTTPYVVFCWDAGGSFATSVSGSRWNRIRFVFGTNWLVTENRKRRVCMERFSLVLTSPSLLREEVPLSWR